MFAPAIIALLVVSGCSRAWYRTQADHDVDDALAQKGGFLDHGTVNPRADSRLADPSDPDRPPLPPDDPDSHQLMHHIDGMDGFARWHQNGDAARVDAMTWADSLPWDESGNVVVSLDDAVRVARVNSRDYQSNLEDLYLSALDVTFERFRFDHQFQLFNATGASFQGKDRVSGPGSSVLATDTAGTVSRMTSTGGELFLGLANSLVWEFSGGDGDLLQSTFDFSLVQPLLRFGGRVFALEGLTQSERTLLANVRQMEQFRQGFYVDVVAGRNPGPGPTRRGDVGQAGLGLIAGVPSGRAGSADAGGYLGLLQDQQQIRNQVGNIAALRDSLHQLEAAFDANRINGRLQVDQARQALLNGQSNLLSARAAYETRVDSFKIDLGLPPELPLQIEDSLLDRFTLIDPELSRLQDDLGPILFEIRTQRETHVRESMQISVAKTVALQPRIIARIESAQADLDRLKPRLADRVLQLQRVGRQVHAQNADVDPRIYDDKLLLNRVAYLDARLPGLAEEMAANHQSRQGFGEQTKELKEEDAWKALNADASRLSDLLLELSLLQAEARLQGIVLIPLEVAEHTALPIARERRLDWKNARANLVDAWRQIEFDANQLESDLDLVLQGQATTRGDNIAELTSDDTSLTFGLEIDTPVNRLAERNRYRETLINYQRARRDYMLFEDRVTQSIRNTVRIIELSRVNFEVRRAAVQVAIAQVDIARLSLNPPAKPEQPARRSSPTAARDLVSALTDLLDAQNDFLNVWVNYEVLRILLDFELGTMQLDNDGIWIDPGPRAVEPTDDASQPVEQPTQPADTPPPAPANAAAGDAGAVRNASRWRATTRH